MSHHKYQVPQQVFNSIVSQTFKRQRDRLIHVYGDALRMACDYRAGKFVLTKNDLVSVDFVHEFFFHQFSSLKAIYKEPDPLVLYRMDAFLLIPTVIAPVPGLPRPLPFIPPMNIIIVRPGGGQFIRQIGGTPAPSFPQLHQPGGGQAGIGGPVVVIPEVGGQAVPVPAILLAGGGQPGGAGGGQAGGGQPGGGREVVRDELAKSILSQFGRSGINHLTRLFPDIEFPEFSYKINVFGLGLVTPAEAVPSEIWHKIFKFLPLPETQKFRLVSKRFNSFVLDHVRLVFTNELIDSSGYPFVQRRTYQDYYGITPWKTIMPEVSMVRVGEIEFGQRIQSNVVGTRAFLFLAYKDHLRVYGRYNKKEVMTLDKVTCSDAVVHMYLEGNTLAVLTKLRNPFEVYIYNVSKRPERVSVLSTNKIHDDLTNWWTRFNNRPMEVERIGLAKDRLVIYLTTDGNYYCMSYVIDTKDPAATRPERGRIVPLTLMGRYPNHVFSFEAGVGMVISDQVAARQYTVVWHNLMNGLIYTRKIELPGQFGNMRIDKKSGAIIATVSPSNNLEYLCFPNTGLVQIYYDPIPNPQSRVCIDGYSVSCHQGLSTCKHTTDPKWRKFGKGMRMLPDEALFVDRYGCVKFSNTKVSLYKYSKMIG